MAAAAPSPRRQAPGPRQQGMKSSLSVGLADPERSTRISTVHSIRPSVSRRQDHRSGGWPYRPDKAALKPVAVQQVERHGEEVVISTMPSMKLVTARKPNAADVDSRSKARPAGAPKEGGRQRAMLPAR